MWHHFRHQIHDLKDGLAEVQREVAALQQAGAQSKAWQEDTASPQLQRLREDVDLSEKKWREEADRLSKTVQLVDSRVREDFQAGLRDSHEHVQAELQIVRERHNEHLATCANLQDGLYAIGENRVALQRSVALVAEEDRARFGKHEHEMARSLSEFEAHMQEELARLSKEHYDHRREQNAILQDRLERFDAELRKDMAELSMEHRSKQRERQGTEARQAASLEDLEDKLRQLGKASEEHARLREDLRGATQSQLGTLSTSLETLAATLRHELGGVSEDRSKEALLLKRELEALKQQAVEAGKEAATVKGWLAEILAVPFISKSLR